MEDESWCFCFVEGLALIILGLGIGFRGFEFICFDLVLDLVDLCGWEKYDSI